jgi:hypothetical protein
VTGGPDELDLCRGPIDEADGSGVGVEPADRLFEQHRDSPLRCQLAAERGGQLLQARGEGE